MAARRNLATGKDDVLLREDIIRIDAVEADHRRVHAILAYLRER